MEGVCNIEDSDVMSQTCVLSEFSECAEVRAVISSLPDIHHDLVRRENTFEKFVGKSLHVHARENVMLRHGVLNNVAPSWEDRCFCVQSSVLFFLID